MNTARQQAQVPTWEDAQEHLRGRIGDDAFKSWFQGAIGAIEEADGVYVLRLLVPGRFFLDGIRDRFSSEIETIWRRFAPNGTVIFQVQDIQTPELEKGQRTPEKLPAKIIQFPLFPAETRPVANNMARSALFSCVQGKDRQMLEDALLASQDGQEIRFTGRQLNQDDHDLLMQLIKMANQKPLGEYTTVPANAILTELDRKTGGHDHKLLHADITRLMTCVVNLRDTKRRVEYLGHLVEEAFQDESSRHWSFKFNPKLRALYDDKMYTLLTFPYVDVSL